MSETYLKLRIDQFKVYANYSVEDCDEEPQEIHTLHLLGNMRIGFEEERALVQAFRARRELHELFDEIELVERLDEHFFAEATQTNIAGTGSILEKEEYDELGAHIFTIVVSDEIYEYLLERADLAINQRKGVLRCQLGIPDRMFGDEIKPPRDVHLPITGYYFEYDSRSDAD